MPGPAPEYRLFFAIRPSQERARRIRQFTDDIRTRHGLRGRPIGAERLHITLTLVDAGPEPPPQTRISQAIEAARRVSGRPFLVALNRLATFNNGPLVLLGDEGLAGVESLQADLWWSLGKSLVDDRLHMSLIWSPDSVAEQLVEPITFTVHEFVLIRSRYGESRHEVLARFPLLAGQA
jgi:2'-5' RNA ligase